MTLLPGGQRLLVWPGTIWASLSEADRAIAALSALEAARENGASGMEIGLGEMGGFVIAVIGINAILILESMDPGRAVYRYRLPTQDEQLQMIGRGLGEIGG
ncbi:hypothetical protein QTH97_22860 [Variovorax sp. J22R24]|uniref:hypothetical protein n=1 Tax=Variovorax gracilis TaxID=3053502 RepID=UPI002579045C|nr:hypothetical protein [Variovorax sp. J22R24]MDM0107805.1 hypothetical protein [Variovorax sp. J22R24]